MNDTNLVKQLLRKNFNNEEYYATVIPVSVPDYEFFYKNVALFNIPFLIKYSTLESKIIEHIIEFDLETMDNIIIHSPLSEKVLEDILKSTDQWHIDQIQVYQRIPCKLITKYWSKLNVRSICSNQYLDLRFLIDNKEQLNWSEIMLNVLMHPVINEGFITLFHEYDIWSDIGFTNIPLDTLVKYIQFFNDQSFEGILERYEKTKEEIIEMASHEDQFVNESFA